MKIFRLPLVARLALAIAVLILLPATIMTAYLYKRDRDAAIDTEMQRINSYSREIAVQVDSFIVSKKNIARYAVASSELRSFLERSDNPAVIAELSSWLAHWAGITQNIAEVFVMDPQGECLASTNPSFVGKNYGMRPYFKEARKGLDYVGDWTVGITSRKPGIYLSSPIIVSGKDVGGILAIKLEIDEIDSIIRRSYELGVQVFIVNSTGVLLAYYDPALRYATLDDLTPAEGAYIKETRQFADIPQPSLKLASLRKDAAAVRPGDTHISAEYRFQGGRKIAALTGTNAINWVVGVTVPFSAIEAPANRLLYTFIPLALLVLLFTALSSYYVSRFIVRPLGHLLHDVTVLGAGDYSVRSVVRGDDEVARLAKAFNSMAQMILTREQQLIKLRNYLLNIIDSMPSMLFSLNSKGEVTHWNAAAAHNTDIAAAEAIGKIFWEIRPELAKYRGTFEDVLKNNAPRTLMRELVTDRTKRYFNIAIFPLAADACENDREIVLRLDDITEIETKEEQLRHMQKMELVGTLAGGLAHDFNNVLCGILGTVTILERQIRRGKEFSPEKLCEKLEVVVDLGNRAAEIVAQLLVISRKQEASLALVDLKFTISHVMNICQNTFDKSIDISTVIPETPIMVHADSRQIEQVLLNLCVNASHAMTIMREAGDTHGGKLSIATERLQAGRHFCATHPEAAEAMEYWLLSVQDTGIGMDTQTIDKIFDPFFTTKELGKGTGLGLAMVDNIVRQHNGFLEVYSEEGIGSTFNIYLPVFSGDAVAITGNSLQDLPMGDGLLLVVDDEPSICQAAKSILEECGYQVILAENGEVAVSIYSQRSHEIKAVVMDMIMPKKSGIDAFIEMKRIDPDVRVLLASGFMQDERIAALTELGVREVIKKPYTMYKLAKTVARIMA